MSDRGKTNRRVFLTAAAATAGAISTTGASFVGQTKEATSEPPTIQEVIDRIIKDTTGKPLPPETCDTLKTGDPSQKVTGIVTTFRSTFAVLRKARELGANLVVTHEPTFYNHYDKVDWLQGDPAYGVKRKLIDEAGIAIWRFHDYWHSAKPDGIIRALARRLDLRQIDPENKRLYTISELTFAELCRRCKKLFGITHLMAVGDPEMLCRRVGVFAGWGGNFGQEHVEMFINQGVDAVISGEAAEWTGSVYARDAITAGFKKGLIALGHAASEEPGMEDAAEWLRVRFPGVRIVHVPALSPFEVI
ncbi:MAG: Nif3-like dinuclear metal center hexameric protein [Acidobacteriota bacterium]